MRSTSTTFLILLVLLALAAPSAAQVTSYDDISPDNSDTDDLDPDGASGGRVNGLAIDPQKPHVMYAASEWGGLYKSTDSGLTWDHLPGHLPVASWDVEIDPGTPTRLYATSFYDGRVDTLAGINVSLDGGVTWTRPASASPPEDFCVPFNEAEPSAFGITIAPDDPANVFAGTNCGLAVSSDFGDTWTYRDPTPPEGSGSLIWDVLALGGGVVHICGNDGHLRSDDGGDTWVAGSGLPSGRCSLAVSPDESYVLFAVAGTTIYESDDANSPAGATWTQTRANLSPQGRIPFVQTNQRSDALGVNVFDLWFGDVRLWRVSCTTPTPPAPGGPPRCGTGDTPPWAGPFTRSAGAHDDTGAMLFDPVPVTDRCPLLMSSDGGVYYNTDATADCHNPDWEQPDVTPHALWPWTMSAVDRAGNAEEDLYFGNQDNGVFGTTEAGGALPPWHNADCCDGFDSSGDDAGGLFSVCCFSGRLTRFFRSLPGAFDPIEINNYPPSGLAPTFDFPDSVAHIEGSSYVMLTRDCTLGSGGCTGADGGVFVTEDIDASPVVWTELGDATEPNSGILCAVYTAKDPGLPRRDASGPRPLAPPTNLFVQIGNCNSRQAADRLYRYFGTDPGGTWEELTLPEGGFGVVAVHPDDSNRLLASGLTPTDGAMYSSTDGGFTWSPMPALDDLMTGGGAFPFRNRRGPNSFTSFVGYWQPSLVAFDPASDRVVAGGQDSGIFLSSDGGASWSLITDPHTSDVSGIPHLPRPRYGYFDSEDGVTESLYIGSQGRGIWRLGLAPPSIFADDFESGDTSAWSATVP